MLDHKRPTLTSLSPGTQQKTSLMYTERALSWHTRNRFMLSNLACPITRLRGGMRLGYTTVQRLHHRQTWSHGTEGWMLVKIINEWLCDLQLFSKVWILEILIKAIRIPDPYPVHVWKQFLDIRIWLQTHYPAGYSTGKPDSVYWSSLIPFTYTPSTMLPYVLFFRQIWLFFDLVDRWNLRLVGGGFFGGKFGGFLYKISEMITIRFAGWISGRIVSLLPDTDIQKLLSNMNRIRIRISETVYQYFEDSDFWKKLHIAQSLKSTSVGLCFRGIFIRYIKWTHSTSTNFSFWELWLGTNVPTSLHCRENRWSWISGRQSLRNHWRWFWFCH